MKKKFFLTILIGMFSFASDEEKICTLIEQNGIEISERKAKTLDKYEKVMIKTETNLYLENGECIDHKYDHTSTLGIDNYKGEFEEYRGYYLIKEGISIFDQNKNIYKCIATSPDTDGKFLYVTYKCREANFLEKGKIKTIKVAKGL